MNHPCLVVGVGGTGVRVVRRIKRLAEQKRASGKAWVPVEVLAIDFDHDAAETSDPPATKGRISTGPLLVDDFLYLNPVRIQDALRNLDRMDDATPVWSSVLEWFPNRSKTRIPFGEAEANGARQLRPLGRLGLFLNDEQVESRLRMKLNRLLERATEEGQKRQPRVMIVSSVSGGTGAGCVIDLAYLLRRQEGRPFVYLYLLLPEVFQEVDSGRRLLPNGYACLSELALLKDQAIDFQANYLRIPPIRIQRGDEQPFSRVFLFRHAAYDGAEGIRRASDEMAYALSTQFDPEIQRKTLSAMSNTQLLDLRPGRLARRSACFSTVRAVVFPLLDGGSVEQNIYRAFVSRLAGSSTYVPPEVPEVIGALDRDLKAGLTASEADSPKDIPAAGPSDKTLIYTIQAITREWSRRLLQGFRQRIENTGQRIDESPEQAAHDLKVKTDLLRGLVRTHFSDLPANEKDKSEALDAFIGANRFDQRMDECFGRLANVIRSHEPLAIHILSVQRDAITQLKKDTEARLAEVGAALRLPRTTSTLQHIARWTGLSFLRRWWDDMLFSGAYSAAQRRQVRDQEQNILAYCRRGDFGLFVELQLTLRGCNHLLRLLDSKLHDTEQRWREVLNRLPYLQDAHASGESSGPTAAKSVLIDEFVIKYFDTLMQRLSEVPKESVVDLAWVDGQIGAILREVSRSGEAKTFDVLKGRLLRVATSRKDAEVELERLIGQAKTNVFVPTTPDASKPYTFIFYPTDLDWEGGDFSFRNFVTAQAVKVFPGPCDSAQYDGTAIVIYHESLEHPIEHVAMIDRYMENYEAQPNREIFHLDGRWASLGEFERGMRRLERSRIVLCGNHGEPSCYYEITSLPRDIRVCPGCDQPIRSRCGNKDCTYDHLDGDDRRFEKTCPACRGFNHSAWWCCEKHGNVPFEVPIDKESCPRCIEEYQKDPARHPFDAVSRRPDLKDRVECPSCVLQAAKDPGWLIYRVPRKLVRFYRDGVNGHDLDVFKAAAGEQKLPDLFRCPHCRAPLIPVHHGDLEKECR